MQNYLLIDKQFSFKKENGRYDVINFLIDDDILGYQIIEHYKDCEHDGFMGDEEQEYLTHKNYIDPTKNIIKFNKFIINTKKIFKNNIDEIRQNIDDILNHCELKSKLME